MREKQPQGAVVAQSATPDWNAFLRILAPQFIRPGTPISISKGEETISFELDTVRVEEFRQHFARALQSSESLDLQLSYKNIATVSADSSSGEMPTVESPRIENLEQAKSFMAKLFGAETMDGKNKAFPINFNSFFEKYEKGVLISNPGAFFSSDMIKEGQKFLCGHFNGVDTHILRQIISEEAPHLQAPNKDIMESTGGEGFVQTCFGFVGATSQVYFNIGRFLQLIYPPQIHIEEVNESKTRIVISASHLLLYVKQLSRHGILFAVEVKHGRASAHPVLLPHKETRGKPVKVFIVLDDSGSMSQYRNQLFLNVKNLIERIKLAASEATIHLTIFSGRDETISETAIAKEFVYTSFSKPALSGYTALYDALLKPLEETENTLRTHNTVLMVFTDGADNQSATRKEALISRIEKLQKSVAAGDIPPEVHAIGYGEVNEDVLNALAQAACPGRKYTKLESFDNLEPLIQGIEGFEYSRVMAQFKTTIDGIEETHELPISLSGQPQVVTQVTVPLSRKPVTVSFRAPTRGQELALSQVTLQMTMTQAQQTMGDYEEKADAIYADETTVIPLRIAQLNEVLREVNTFCTQAPQQAVLALQADLQEKINRYKAILLAQQDALGSAESSSISGMPILGRDSPIAGRSSPTSRDPAVAVEEKHTAPSPR